MPERLNPDALPAPMSDKDIAEQFERIAMNRAHVAGETPSGQYRDEHVIIGAAYATLATFLRSRSKDNAKP